MLSNVKREKGPSLVKKKTRNKQTKKQKASALGRRVLLEMQRWIISTDATTGDRKLPSTREAARLKCYGGQGCFPWAG